MLLSIIIPAYNEASGIERTLEKIKQALKEQRGDPFLWEIIVCDNNSSDQTAELASRAGAKVVFEPVNQISRARKFIVLHHHPVITAGRKGEISPRAIFTLVFSTMISTLFFLLYYLLPKKLSIKDGSRFLGYWYNRRH